MTSRTWCGWVKFRECILYGTKYDLTLKGAVLKSFVRPAILYGSESWCLKKARLEFCKGYIDESYMWSTTQT